MIYKGWYAIKTKSNQPTNQPTNQKWSSIGNQEVLCGGLKNVIRWHFKEVTL